jgi:uncharacterized protein (TIGR02266 family)
MARTPVGAKTVLIGNDTALVCDRFQAALGAAGHAALAVKDATDLLASLTARLSDVDLIVLDLRLPNGGGVNLLRSIRAIDGGRLPILIFSGTIANAAEVRDLSAFGIAGYINEHCAAQQIVPALAPHLFPDSFNRRSSLRVALGSPVQYQQGSTIAAALALNLGHGGMAIRTTSPLDLNARLKIRFKLPGAKGDIEAEGRVAWSDRRVGMGVQFEKVDAGSQLLVDNFVDAHFFSNRKP